ncbi:MAG: hypothetical protein ACJ766_14635 [Thermoleophilaceae bacterium]
MRGKALRAGALAIVFLISVSVASAARPAAKARYAGVAGDHTSWTDLRVSSDRRGLQARRSSIELVYADCGHPERRTVFRLGSRRKPVRVSRRGRFRFVRRKHKFTLRVSGRLKTKDVLGLSFRYRRSPVRGSHPCDDSGLRRLTLERVRRGHPVGCAEVGHTLLWTPEARAFHRIVPTGDVEVPTTPVAYGCLFSRDRAVRLDEDFDPDSDLRLFRLAGPYVGYVQDFCPMGCGWNVYVVDLRNGKKLTINIGSEGYKGGPATDLVLAPSGSVAWILDATPNQVEAQDLSGRRVLDSGEGIALKSLELHGSTLTWVNSGVVRSATLH